MCIDNPARKKRKPTKFFTEHQQVTCRGTNLKTGKPFEFMCDRGMVNILKDLNSHGIKTTYSCQGDYKGGTGYFGPYLIFKNRGAKNALLALEIIKKHWKRYWVRTSINDYTGDIVVNAYYTHMGMSTVARMNHLRFD